MDFMPYRSDQTLFYSNIVLIVKLYKFFKPRYLGDIWTINSSEMLYKFGGQF